MGRSKAKNESSIADSTAKIKESAADIITEGKKIASDIYQQGVGKVEEKVSHVEDKVQDLSGELVKKIHANPIGSVLVAVGVGMLISSLFRK